MANPLYKLLGIIDNLTAVRQSVEGREHMLIRPFNQAILMYPTAILGIWCFGLLKWTSIEPATLGRIYLWTFLVNLLILFFDLKFGKAVIILFSIVIASFVLDALGWLGNVTSFLGELEPVMNSTFYLLMSIIWGMVFFFIWLDRRSHIIVVEPNHIVIHDKWIGEAQSYPTENVTFSKEIEDALELMLGFGTLKINNANTGHLIRAVPHVFRPTHTTDQIKRVTAQFQVEQRSSSSS